MRLHPGSRLGPYEIESLIGSGGMGEVYRAVDTRLDRLVAIKVLPEEFESHTAASERFHREAKAASAINHPSVCTVYDVGVEPPFIAMELLEGESLRQRLERGRIDIDSLIPLAIAMAEGLEAAHSHGIIHRDIKPANIFLTPGGPKLLDFGVAKMNLAVAAMHGHGDARTVTDALVTEAGATVGTVAYMSPEQLLGKALDARTDIFSLGLVFYEMATGCRAFSGATTAALSSAILFDQPTPPRDLVEIPIRLEEIILKSLEKDREDRYQTVADLRADLRRLRRGVDSVPHHATIGHPGVKPVSGVAAQRWFALTVGTVLLVAAAGGFFYWRTQANKRAATLPLTLEGARIERLTTSGDALRPAIAPDGKYLAYVRQQDGHFSLHVRQTATASTVEIVPAEPGVVLFGATVSPDSGFVDYIRRAQGGSFELWRIPFLGGSVRRLREGVHSPIGWSPDAQRFAYVRANLSTGATSVVVVNADGTEERTLIERRRPAQFFSLMIAVRPSIAPAWSPDGQFIAVIGAGAGQDPGRADVAVIDVKTGAQHTIPLPDNTVRGLAWFDDGTLLLNAVTSNSSLQVHQLSRSSGQMNQLTRDVHDYEGISVAADRKTLICAVRERRVDLAVVASGGQVLAASPHTTLSHRTGSARAKWAGEHVVFGNWRWLPGSSPQQFLDANVEERTATGDGAALVVRKDNALWRTDHTGAVQALLVSGDAWAPTITPDNRWVVFLSSRTGIQTPWIVSMAGGEPRQLVNHFVAGPGVDVSRDGKRMVFPSRDEKTNRPVIALCQFEGCREPKLLLPHVGGRVRWTPDGRAITYIETERQRNLWTVPAEGGSPAQLTRFEDRAIVDFDWSLDGTRLVVARRTEINDIVMWRGVRRQTPR